MEGDVARVNPDPRAQAAAVESLEQAAQKKPVQREEIVVTGSRIPIATKEAAQEVKQIDQSGETTLSEFLNTLPDVSLLITQNGHQARMPQLRSSRHAGSRGTSVSEVHCSPMYAENIVADEPAWRVLRETSAIALSASKVIVTRWRASSERTEEFGAETTADCHVVKIVLRSMNIRFSVSGRTVQDGVTTPGTVHVTEPALPVRCLFREPYDVLHLHVPNTLIAECARDMPGHQAPMLRSEAVPSKDIVIDWLGRALLEANRVEGSFGPTYADCISMAIVARLLASASGVATSERSRGSKLAPWRLKRAIDYVEARLDEPVSLADVASSAGLTRMHFAAQFRAATGFRPHEYLLRRRIERAQEMLLGTGMSLVDVALSVGFQTQSHFTSVFKRYAGQAPRAWRESRDVQTG